MDTSGVRLHSTTEVLDRVLAVVRRTIAEARAAGCENRLSHLFAILYQFSDEGTATFLSLNGRRKLKFVKLENNI